MDQSIREADFVGRDQGYRRGNTTRSVSQHWGDYRTAARSIQAVMGLLFWLKIRGGFGEPPEEEQRFKDHEKKMAEFDRRLAELSMIAHTLEPDLPDDTEQMRGVQP